MKILHIAAHLGAGAGKAIAGLALADESDRCQILLTDEPQKMGYIHQCQRRGIEVQICPSDSVLDKSLQDADVVIINWWHHPSLYKTLMRLHKIPSRVVLWSHVNGWGYPVLSASFASVFDACMFTADFALSSPHWSPEELSCIAGKSYLVYGTGDFRPLQYPFKQTYRMGSQIKIGYVGSLDKAKIHPDLLGWCMPLLQQMNCRLYMAGDPSQELLYEIARRNLSDKIVLMGYRDDIPELLPTFDVFVYLLNPDNFATTENALLEAMAAGLPVIAGSSATEQSIVLDGHNGMIARNEKDFLKKARLLLGDLQLRKKLGENARNYVVNKYNTENNMVRFSDCIHKACKSPKTFHDFGAVVGTLPIDWFLSGCGNREKGLFHEMLGSNMIGFDSTMQDMVNDVSPVFRGNSKGSVRQFARCFPEDKDLNKLEMILR